MSVTKQVTGLTISERLAAFRMLNAGKFNNDTLKDVLDDIRSFAITDEDWAKANRVITPTNEELAALPEEVRKVTDQTWKWDDTITTDIAVHQGTVDAINALVKERSDNNDLTVQDGPVLSLQDKLNA